MAMTTKVYEVSREGTVHVVHPEAEVVPAMTVDQRAAYPACQCDQCKTQSS